MIKTCSPDYIIADIVAECPEAPAVLIQRSLMKAVRRMASACLWECWIEIPTQDNVQRYPFERYLPEGYSVQYVQDVEYNGCCIECLDDKCGQMCAAGYVLDDLCQITLRGYCPQSDPKDPECRDTLRIKVALKPKNDTCELPCDLVERFETELYDGTMGNLLSMKNKPWTDYKVAEYHENQFEGGLASAKCLNGNKMNNKGASIEAACIL